MKFYTITLDERQMEFIRNTMESQVEISADVAQDAYSKYQKYGTDGNWNMFERSSADFYIASAINNMLKYADSEEENV